MIFVIFFSQSAAFAQYSDYKVIVTTQGHPTVNRYSSTDFREALGRDFRMVGDVSLSESDFSQGGSKVNIQIGNRQFNFVVSEEMPVVRLIYDRNRRIFSGAGCNFIEDSTAVYKAPTFKGMRLAELPEKWMPDIDKLISDKSLLSADEPTLFLLEADIDENGIVHKITELNGTLRQYSKVIIDQIYDKAIRGWEPATCDGKPYRTLAQIQLLLSRGSQQ